MKIVEYAVVVGVTVSTMIVEAGKLRYLLQKGSASGRLDGVRSKRRKLSALQDARQPRVGFA